jgi:hypothetical protein
MECEIFDTDPGNYRIRLRVIESEMEKIPDTSYPDLDLRIYFRVFISPDTTLVNVPIKV